MSYRTTISNTTAKKRAQIKALQDEFMTFSWGGINAWDEFGAFIINDSKGSLKFYNGPGFNNEYTKPQFDSGGGHLQGVTFNKQTISFTIGVYWFSIEQYRKLLNWLNPMKIDYLTFGFDSNFRYDVKLSKIGDSTRWVIGRENGEPRYYTELSLSFEIQGTPCAKGLHPYEFRGGTDSYWSFSTQDRVAIGEASLNIGDKRSFVKSDLETPVRVTFKINLQQDLSGSNYFASENGEEVFYAIAEFDAGDESNIKLNSAASSFDENGGIILTSSLENLPTKYYVTLKAHYEKEDLSQEVVLVEMVLQNLTFFRQEGKSLTFTYNSETGLVFLTTTNETPSLLSLQTYADTNDFILEQLHTNKFMLPGEFQFPGFYDGTLSFSLSFEKRRLENNIWEKKTINSGVYNQLINIECYPRTNIV